MYNLVIVRSGNAFSSARLESGIRILSPLLLIATECRPNCEVASSGSTLIASALNTNVLLLHIRGRCMTCVLRRNSVYDRMDRIYRCLSSTTDPIGPCLHTFTPTRYPGLIERVTYHWQIYVCIYAGHIHARSVRSR